MSDYFYLLAAEVRSGVSDGDAVGFFIAAQQIIGVALMDAFYGMADFRR